MKLLLIITWYWLWIPIPDICSLIVMSKVTQDKREHTPGGSSSRTSHIWTSSRSCGTSDAGSERSARGKRRHSSDTFSQSLWKSAAYADGLLQCKQMRKRKDMRGIKTTCKVNYFVKSDKFTQFVLPKSLLRAMTVSQCGQWNLATFSVCFCRMCIFMVPLWVNRAWQM